MRRLAVVGGLLLCTAALPATVTVTDDRGQPVTVDGPASRIASLAPFITELVFAAGAGDRLVAVSEHSDYPPPARTLTRVGNAFNVNLERLLAARPDLVISWGSGIDPRIVQRLETMAIPVFVLEPRTLEDVAGTLRRLGRLLGTRGRAERRAGEFQASVADIGARYAGRERVRVFYQISREPLMTLNGAHMISAVLELCGGENIFRELDSIAPTVNREQVLARNPDVILISVAGGGPDHRAAQWRRFQAMTAVRHDNVYTVDANLLNRQTPRLVEGARQVCRLLDRARARLAVARETGGD